MALRLIWSPAARQDLRDLQTYIADYNPIAARQFIRTILRTVEQLPDFPESGRIVPEFQDPAIRELIKRPCRVVYRIQRDRSEVEIARVWHASRGVPEI